MKMRVPEFLLVNIIIENAAKQHFSVYVNMYYIIRWFLVCKALRSRK